MNKFMLLVLGLLIPICASGSCFTVTFERSAPYGFGEIGTVSGVIFPPAWWSSQDCDACLDPNHPECNQCFPTVETCSNSFTSPCSGVYMDHYGWMAFADFANEPSGNYVAFIQPGEPFIPEQITVTLPTNTHYLSLKYSASYNYIRKVSATWLDAHFGGALPGYLQIFNSNHQFLGQVELTEDGSVGCQGDPNGQLCKWFSTEIYNQQDIRYFILSWTGSPWGSGPSFIDDLKVCTTLCPNPPCEFE